MDSNTAQVVLKDCHDCWASPGQVHEEGCDVERCSYCGGQKICCGCREHDDTFSRWTGIWPGQAEAQALGISLNAVVGHIALLLHGKPGARLVTPDVDLINRLLPELRKVGHKVTAELHEALREGMPSIDREEVDGE